MTGDRAAILRQRIVARLMTGEAGAVADAVRALPARIDIEAARAIRDQEIRAIAADVAAWIPNAATWGVAQIVAKAGEQLSSGRKTLPPSPPFDAISDADRAQLAMRVSEILEWAPHWPRHRQMIEIIDMQSRAIATA